MTRRIKDFLSLGEWKEGFDDQGRPIFGKYDEAELKIILNNAIAMMAAGDPINLGKSHGDEQMIIPTDELISPVDEIKLHNGVLWFSTYVTPKQAEYLDNPAIKVSAGMFPDYTAGNKAFYKGRTLLHIAATDRPVVGKQGRFLALSNYVSPVKAAAPVTSPAPTPAAAKPVVPGTVPGQVKPAAKPVLRQINRPGSIADRVRQRIAKIPGRNIRFGNDVLPRAIAMASTLGGGKMDFAALLAVINAIFKALGLGQLPDTTTEENIVPRLEGLAMALGGEVTTDEPPAGGDDPPKTDAGAVAAGAGAPAMMTNILRNVDARITQANKPILAALEKLTTIATAKAGEVVLDAKAKYILFRNALAKHGVIEADLAKKDKIAEKCDWDPDVLEGMVPTIKMSNLVSAAGATVEPPIEKNEPSGALTREQLEARVKARGGNVANIPA
jgi:hypothetical protein